MLDLPEHINDLLSELEELDEREKYWIVGPKTGHMLYWLIRVVSPEHVLEIGTSIGYSGIWMASALEANGKGKLWTVESHKQRFQLAQEHIGRSGLDHRIEQVKGHAPEIFTENESLPKSLDLAFFDATKYEHKSFFDAVMPLMNAGGLIIADNVQSHPEAMGEFVQTMYTNDGLKVVEIPVGTGLIIGRVI